MNSIVHNSDCLEAMKQYPDKHFELAIVDPPYGIGEDGGKDESRIRPTKEWKSARAKGYKKGEWDNEPPSIEYFNELTRVSKNIIIWGANHFISRLALDSPCWIVWDKDNSGDFADCELALTSFPSAVRKFKWRWNGMIQEDMKNKESRIHPTQKPVQLYKWLLKNYAKEGDKILDTHLGSGSSRIAAFEMGFDFTGYELDTDYFLAQEKRFNQHISQLKLFSPNQEAA